MNLSIALLKTELTALKCMFPRFISLISIIYLTSTIRLWRLRKLRNKIIPLKKQCRKYRRCIVYRHPTTLQENLISALNERIMKITKSNQTFYIGGDFNVNISPDFSNPSADDFLNMILRNSAFPTITIPTSVTENSKTIIDNIITDDSNVIYCQA